MYLITDIGRELFFEILQIITGCLLSISFFKLLNGRVNKLRSGIMTDVIVIIIASFCGILLPLGIYGIIPILAAAIAMGIKYYTVLPLLISNVLFNSLVPYADASFVWRTGAYRIILAFIVGICSGMILMLLKIDRTKVLRISMVESLTGKTGKLPGLLKYMSGYINTIGPYLIFGVILNAFFSKYIYYKLMNTVDIGAIATTVFSQFKGYDITTPVFLLTMTIFKILMNLVALSGLLALFKWRGIIGYFLHFSIWVLVLALLNIVF